MYLRYVGKSAFEWKEEPEDPLRKESVPENMHGVRVSQLYERYREEALKAAYSAVMGSAGGREDLARYILYREMSLGPVGFGKIEEEALQTRALERAAEHVERRVKEAEDAGLAAAVTAGGLAAAAAACAFFAPWVAAGLAAAAAAAGIVSGTNYSKARDLKDLNSMIKDIKSGREVNLNAAAGAQSSWYQIWQEARLDLEEKRAVLALYCGGGGEGGLSYTNFSAALSAVLENAGGKVGAEEFAGYYTAAVYEAAGAASAEDTLEAVNKLNEYLKREEAARLSALEEAHIKRLRQGQNNALEGFRAAAQEGLSIPEGDRERLRALALAAGDIRLSAGERQAAREGYERLARGYIQDSTAELREVLEGYARSAFGAGSWSQREHEKRLLALYETAGESRTDYNRAVEPYTQETLEEFKTGLISALIHAAEAGRGIKEQEWSLVRQEFMGQAEEWNVQMGIILRKSAEEWEKAEERINREYSRWRENFLKGYTEQADAWRESYEGYLSGKDEWIMEQYLYAANYGNRGILEGAGLSAAEAAGAAVREALGGLEGLSLEERGFDSAGYIEELLGGSSLGVCCASRIK